MNSLWAESSLAWLYKGDVLKAQKDYNSAIDSYNKAIDLNNFSGDPARIGDAFLQRGETQREQQKVAEAFESFLQASNTSDFSSQSRKAWSFYRQGEMLVWMGRYDDAIFPLKQSFTIDPNLYHAYSLLGLVDYKLLEPSKALAAWQTAIKLEPKYIWPYLYMAQMYRDQGNDRLAIEIYNQILAIEPNNETCNKWFDSIRKANE